MVFAGSGFLLVSLVLKVEFLLLCGSKCVLVLFIVSCWFACDGHCRGGLPCVCMFPGDVGSRAFICGG